MTLSVTAIDGRWEVELRRGAACHAVQLDAGDEFEAASSARTLLEIWHRNWMRTTKKVG